MKHVAVIGSGPNGLSAAIALARAGARVTVYEAESAPGGSVRTEEATLPGFLHDIGSAVYPMAIASPFFQSLDLAAHGLEWIEPDVPVAHPLEGGGAVALFHSMEETVDGFGEDGEAWRRLIGPLVRMWPQIGPQLLSPLLRLPRHPLVMAKFGLHALQAATITARGQFRTSAVRALFAGLAGHANIPLERAATSAFALVLGTTAHAGGWPIARGGAQSITTALVSALRSAGGEVILNRRVESLRQFADADAVLLDLPPQSFLALAGSAMPAGGRPAYERFQRGSGTFKIDWALAGPVPWQNPLCRRAGTIHIGASLEEIATSEREVWAGRISQRPYILFSQPSLFDSTRAPAGRHTAWAYCHVPNGSTADATEQIERQIERFAPGFRDGVLARSTRNCAAMERWNSNLLGGDVSGGAMTLAQMVRRPTLPPYRTPMKGVYLCSASTPPGGGVHGMCGALAAATAAHDMGLPIPALV